MRDDYYLSDLHGEIQPSEAEKAFNATTSKKNLSGVRGRASRTGRKGPVMTPVDFLHGKAKKEYMQNSEVLIYNMYEEKVLLYDDFKELPVEKQVVLMTKWRDEIGTSNIIKEMKISRKKFYSEVLKTLGIETKPRGRRPKREIEESKEIAVKETVIPNTEPVSQKGAFTIVFNGQFFGQALTNRLARLARVFDAGEEYEIRVEVKEINNLL
ncbi:MAG: hypothetical protein DDT31_01008 [Syntrophomonadaceae bacterium]|nr:hypothetical protein [Bacillota bacterium]